MQEYDEKLEPRPGDEADGHAGDAHRLPEEQEPAQDADRLESWHVTYADSDALTVIRPQPDVSVSPPDPGTATDLCDDEIDVTPEKEKIDQGEKSDGSST